MVWLIRGFNSNSLNRKIGTYIIVSFPNDVKMVDSNDSKLTNINFQNSDYKLFINKKDNIQKQINQFTYYLDKHIADDLDRSAKSIYNCENRCLFIKYMGHNTFSEFIRNIYLYAYKYEVEDIVVANVPLFEYQDDGSINNSENIEHIRLLETIIYGDEKAQYEKSLNVLFYSDRSPEAVLVGGRNKEEYCYLNNLLPKWYGGSTQSTICQKSSPSIKKLLSTKLFINIKDNDYILPFEIFEISDKENSIVSILRDMIKIYLNEVVKIDDIHIDTGAGYHIDRFMEFKKVFEDSRWVKRLAFRLAVQLDIKKDKKYYLLGTDKYTNMLISLCYTFLGLEDFSIFKYKLFNIYDTNAEDYIELKNKIANIQKEFETFLISSVQVGGKKITKLVEEGGIKSIPAICLDNGQDTHPSIAPLLKIKNEGNIEEIKEDIYCTVCEKRKDKPLLELADKDPFFIKDTRAFKIPCQPHLVT